LNSDGTHDRASLSALAQAIEENIGHEERSDTVHRLLMLSFGRVQFNYHKKLNRSLNTDDTRNVMDFYRHLPHIADWLEAAVHNNAPWLNRMDALGRPKKLMKFGTLQQIVNEADKAMIKASQNGRGFALDDNHEKEVAKLTDGYYLVEMLTAEALDRESSFMQHCIGNGGYDKKLGDGMHRYLSLRDRKGRPHVTIELKKVLNDEKYYSLEATPDGYFWQIAQYYGKQNTKPISKYGEILGPYLAECKLGIKEQFIAVPYIVDRHLNWHPIEKLPETMDISKFLYTGDKDGTTSKRFRMPSKLENVETIGLKNVVLDHFPSQDGEKMKRINLRNCLVRSFGENALSGQKLFLHLEDLSGGDLPEIIECGNIFIYSSSFQTWPGRIKVRDTVGISGLSSDHPIHVTANNVAISVNPLFCHVKHKVRAKVFSFYITNNDDCMPLGVEAETLEIQWQGKLRTLIIPEGTKVSIKIVIQDLDAVEQLHIPESIPDRVLIVDRRKHVQMHVGEYRRQLKHAA
jgi:hypothetical protein